MGLLTTIRNWFWKGGVKLGMTKSLTNITDDSRVAIDPSEYDRIQIAKSYYKDDLPAVWFRNSYGQRQELKALIALTFCGLLIQKRTPTTNRNMTPKKQSKMASWFNSNGQESEPYGTLRSD